MMSDKVAAELIAAHDLLDTLSLTEQDILTVAQRVAGDDGVSVLKYCINGYSIEKFGMLGSHWNLIITIQRKNRKNPEEVNLFVKSVPYDNPPQADFIKSQGIFAKESFFFKEVIPFIMKNYKNSKWTAACYLAKEDVLVMENLRSQGYNLFDMLYDNKPAIKSVLTTLARFHSCSILAEARLRQTSKDYNSLDKYWPNLFNEIMFNQSKRSSVWVQANAKAASTIAEFYGHDPQKIRIAFSKIYEIIQPSETYCNVICHGDLWTNNIMIDDLSEPFNCVLVDFQIIRYAPLALDILQLLHVNTSRDFREKYEKSLIEHYHSILEETIKNNDRTKRTKTPTLKEISAGIDDLRLFGAITACLYRLLGPKIAIECSQSPEQHDKFVSGDVIDVILSYMKKDEIFKNQIQDAISELAEISRIL